MKSTHNIRLLSAVTVSLRGQGLFGLLLSHWHGVNNQRARW